MKSGIDTGILSFMSKRKPYIGVAGFMTSNEIMAAISTLPTSSQRSTHVLSIGILTSAKTLLGETNKYPNRYPKIVEIENILRPVRDVISSNVMPVEIIAHYAVESSETMGSALIRAIFRSKSGHPIDQIRTSHPSC